MRTQVVLFCLLALPFQLLFSQSSSPKERRPLKIGVSITANQYWGDLTESGTRFLRVQPGTNFSLQLAGKSALQLQVNVGFGRFSEQYDGTSDSQTLNQPSSFVETQFGYGELRARYRFLKRQRFQPFLFLGAGLIAFTPKDGEGRFLQDETDSRNTGEVYNTLIPQVPVGLGFEYYVTERVSLESSLLVRMIPTDYLDNRGELGTRNGNDRIYSVSLGMNIQLGTPTKALVPDSSLSGDGPLSVATAETPNDSFALANPEPSPVSQTEPQIEPQVQAEPDPFSPERRQVLREAIEGQSFLYHQISENEDINVLSERYQVPIEMIQELNFLRNKDLKLGTYLRIPDPDLSQSSE